jgi:hypothetical protein
VQLLNTGQVDATAGTITILLYKGTVKSTGKTVWYILTDVSDEGIAQELGLNFSAKMKNINTAARTGNLGSDGNIGFDKGTVNFAPAWDANLYTWTDEAISKGYRQQLREEFQILTYTQDGLITGASATRPFDSAGFSINCPTVQRLD